MDLDTIIYIIATIVIFAVSLLGQKKKKREMPIQSEEEEVAYSLNDFEKILERKEQFEQVQQMNEVEKEKEEPVVLNQVEENSYIQNNNERTDQKRIDRRREKAEKKKINEKEDKEDGFDLNSAVIYSSILERKKFRH